MYKELAKYYDLFYSGKDYQKEAKTITQIIKKYKKSHGRDLLDLACGTGIHTKMLKAVGFKVLGLDISEPMLKIARKNLPGVKFVVADMINFKLNRKFDVITCMFSSMGYAKTYDRLQSMIATISKHTKDGGVVVLESWVARKKFISNLISLETVDKPEAKISRMSISKRQGNISIVTFHYMIGNKGEINYFQDRHECGLFEPKRVKKIMERAGFKTYIKQNGWLKDRPIFVGVKHV